MVKDDKSEEHGVSKKGIEKFKAECVPNNNSMEVSLDRISSDSRGRHCFMRSGNCVESPSKTWSKHSRSNDNSIGPPKIVGRIRKCPEFAVEISK